MEVQLVLLILLEIIFLENSLNQSIIFKVAPYSFLTVHELVSKSRDGASFKKSTRKSCAIKRNEMSTNICEKKIETVARVSSSFKTFIE